MQDTILLLTLISLTFIYSISATLYSCDSTLACGCATSSTVVTSRIIGGELAANYTWGWMVSLRQDGSHICGASLLTSQYAVTAGHCVESVLDDPSALSIVAGTNYLYDTSSSTIQRRTVTKIIIHPHYQSGIWVNDIAILQFSPLTITSKSKLAFICLPRPNQDPFQVNDSLVAIGWGDTYLDLTGESKALRQVTVQAYSSTSTDCLRSGLNDSNVQFCAAVPKGGKDTCQGDSGGPLMAFVNGRWVLAGLTSAGNGCAQTGFPGVYTRVSAFVSFIKSNINATDSDILKISTTTSTNQPIYNQSYVDTNRGNIIGKSILILTFSIFCTYFVFL